MKIAAIDVRIGNLIEHNKRLWRVLKKNIVKPGKGGAFVQLEMKEHGTGSKLNERFRSDDKVIKAHVDQRQMQYLYAEGDSHIFMDNDNFEQLTIDAEDIEEQIQYLLPNTDVQINFHNDAPIGLDLPNTVILQITETEAVIKGQTATSSGKPALLETGLRLSVPQFVNAGDKIKVNTDTGEYMERAE